jgi:hypothetical protein
MPVVPRLEPANISGPRVSPSGVPSARRSADAPIEAFGGGNAPVQAAQKELTDAAVDFANQEREKANQLVVLDADNKLDAVETELMYGKDGIVNTRGKDVFELPDRIMEKRRKALGDIEKGLFNDDQRLSFRRRESSRWQSLNGNMHQHMAVEGRKYDDAITDSAITNAQNRANPDDTDSISNSISDQTATIIDHAKRNGLLSDKSGQGYSAYVQDKIGASISKTHVSVINQLLARGDDLNASGYFNGLPTGTLTKDDEIKVKQALEEGSVRGTAQRESGKIFDEGGTVSDMLAKAEKLKDPKAVTATKQEIRQRITDRDASIKQSQEDLYNALAPQVMKAPPGVDIRTLIAPDKWVALGRDKQEAILKINQDPVNDDSLYLEFRDIPLAEISKLSRADFQTKYWAHFDKAHRARAIELWDAAKEAATKSALDPQLTATVTFKDQVDNALRTSGFIPADKETSKFSKNEAKLYAQFEQSAAEALEHFERTDLGGKRKASKDEIRKIIDDLVMKKVKIDGWGSDIQKPAAAVLRDEVGKAYVPIKEIPRGDQATLRKQIREFSTDVSTDKIERAYAAYLRNDIATYNAIVREK